MKIFIAGICGTFMAGIAQLAKAAGHSVTGCDSNVYPPMSTLLKSADIDVKESYLAKHLDQHYDQIIVGNALSRGNPLVEAILDRNLAYQSGPQWLHDQVLIHHKVMAVAGTHGKTTTSSMATWILDQHFQSTGFLIGGKPGNFDNSAQAGNGNWFVIEADEYDTAFFDKRSKFVHYCPSIAILNNLEFDHADIFDDLDQIKKQFHHLVRIVPANGHIVVNHDDSNLAQVLSMGSWSHIHLFSLKDPSKQWYAKPTTADASNFEVYHHQEKVGQISWGNIGNHNMSNALAAIAAANCAGVSVKTACEALESFIPTARRFQLLFNHDDIYLYEDFAHHPTAIRTTLEAVKNRFENHEIIAVVEPRSNTMRGGYHKNQLGESFDCADKTYIYQPTDVDWDANKLRSCSSIHVFQSSEDLLQELELRIKPNSVIICMSNGSFDGIPRKLRERLYATVVEETT